MHAGGNAEMDVRVKGPAVGEQVQVSIKWQDISQVWQGIVVKDLEQRQFGRQIAILAFSQPFILA
jgi:hypothetical protein